MMALEFLHETQTKRGIRHAIYRCSFCQSETEKRMGNVRSGATNSCGCQASKHKNRRKPDGKNQMQPWEPIASGILVEPLPAPSFDDVTQSQFSRIAAKPLWLIVVGGRVVDRQPMSLTERRQFKQAQQ